MTSVIQQTYNADMPRHKKEKKNHLRGKTTSIENANNHRPFFSRSLQPFPVFHPPSIHSVRTHRPRFSLPSPVLPLRAHGPPPSPRGPPRRGRERQRGSSRRSGGTRADGSGEVAAGVAGGGGRGRGRGLLHLPGSGARPRRRPVRRQAAMRTRVPPRSDSLAPLLGYGVSSSGSASDGRFGRVPCATGAICRGTGVICRKTGILVVFFFQDFIVSWTTEMFRHIYVRMMMMMGMRTARVRVTSK